MSRKWMGSGCCHGHVRSLLIFAFFRFDREFCPVSKAFQLFTMMGLRHVVVLGGETGGEVVGVLSRENFLPAFIKQQTGI